MRIHLITLFPELLSSAFSETAGLLGKAVASGRLQVQAHDLRGFGLGPHQKVDDDPFGGGGGMLMRVEPWANAIAHVRAVDPETHVVLLTPDTVALTQARVRRLAERPSLTLCCPRYEGVDERVRAYVDEEVSVGDFILSGGEYGALCVIDAVARLQPGFMGNAASPEIESYSHPGRVEFAQYTRPPEFEGRHVPAVLLSGDHAAIARFRKASVVARTVERRPDLLQRFPLLREELEALPDVPMPDAPGPAAPKAPKAH